MFRSLLMFVALLVSANYTYTNPEEERFWNERALVSAYIQNNIEKAGAILESISFHPEFITNYFFLSVLNNIGFTNLFLKHGVHIDTQCNYYKHTALILAVLNDNELMVSNLLAKKANPNIADQHGWTPLFYARSIPIIYMLFKHNVDQSPGTVVDITHLDKQGNTILHRKSEMYNADIGVLNTLLAIAHQLAPGLINHCNNYNRAPLHNSCCNHNRTDITELLIKYGAQVNHIIKFGNYTATPFLFALARGHFDVAKVLIKHGAYIKPNPHNYTNPSILMAETGLFDKDLATKIVQVVDIDAYDENGNTALTASIASNNIQYALFLIENGANIEKTFQGQNPLYLALDKGSQEIAGALILAGAQLHTVGSNDEVINKIIELFF